jgi:hypothetical protein
MNGINRYLMLLCLGMMLVACEEISGPPNSFPLPKKLQSHSLPPSITLMGMARIRELNREVPMTILDDRAVATFDRLPTGNYTVEIIFRDSKRDLVLAKAERWQVEVGNSAGNLAFNEEEYTYPDDDKDSYSNLDELRVENDPMDPSNVPIPHRVFITSIMGEGDLSQWEGAGGNTGLSAGDAICSSLAQNAGLSGEYRAWLSDENNDAYCRVIGGSGKKGGDACNPNDEEVKAYVSTGGKAIAESLDLLVDKGQMFHAIQFDEGGKDRANQNLYVWTATNEEGVLKPEYGDCMGWTSNSPSIEGSYGAGETITSSWTNSYKAPCGEDSFAGLYCFQISPADDVLPIYKAQSAKKVFLSSVDGTGNLSSWAEAKGQSGALAGDAICQTLARKANYPNADKFVAWLTDSSTSALDRLVGRGPWARPDGVLVAENRADLTDGSLLTGIAQTEEDEDTYIDYRVWTGTEYEGSCPSCILALNCKNWSSASSLIKPKHGLSSSTYHQWSDVGESWNSDCSDKGHLYCFEGG